MRPIDADVLAQFRDYDLPKDPNDKCFSENDIKLMIHMMPTICSIRIGKWIRCKYGGWRCSYCDCFVRRKNPLKGNIWNYNFCPNCGARMDEVDE